MAYNGTLDAVPLSDDKKVCSSCTIYVVLIAIFFMISTIISSAFIYLFIYLFISSAFIFLKRSYFTNTITNISANTETVIYLNAIPSNMFLVI